jgi:hypothetical protein
LNASSQSANDRLSPTPEPAGIAVRVYPELKAARQKPRSTKTWRRPNALFVFDTETRTDALQSLLFGSFRFIVDGQCLQEGIFHPDDLSLREQRILRRYADSHRADVGSHSRRKLDIFSLSDFLKKLFSAAYKSRCLLVGFNLPFDLSRLAFDVVDARSQFAGGFSLGLWYYRDKSGRQKRNSFRPRIVIKHVDGKRALMAFTARNSPDPLDYVGDEDHPSEKKRPFKGHFLDLRTLAFALTDRGHSLRSACEAFGVEHGKVEAPEHGKISDEYIDYNRRDVQATAELAEKLLEEYDKNPINLQETKAFSPASIGKSYLRGMGITPIAHRHTRFQPYTGYAQTAFFGGRTSAHIRKVPVTVVYTDFLSMYPTVNSLLGLWSFVVANNIKIVDHCHDEITEFLSRLSFDDLFEQQTWKHLAAFVRVLPNGDVVPTRARYNPATNDWQVAVNHLYADKEEDALWFSLPDVVGSYLLTGRIPKIVDAFRLEARGVLAGLKPTKLRGAIDVDPRHQDFFKVVIEERKRLSRRTDLTNSEEERLSKALKVLANSTSYGIYGEMNRQETDRRVPVRCYGIDPEPYVCHVSNPEKPGEYCFPPLASLITGGARLMLALLERSVTDLGGTYAMEDTDSMAVVATEFGGLVPCPGGSEGVKALSWAQVESISKRFTALKPYDPAAVSGPILKIEEDNFDPDTGTQRQIWCYAISAKRYALFVRDSHGNPSLLRKDVNNRENRWSEHGLGHLLNPTNPEDEDREWIAHIWLKIVREGFGLPTKPLGFEPTPAVGRMTVSSPVVMRPLESLNDGQKYCDQIKPFNFLLSCHVRPLGHPVGIDPSRFHLIAPYEIDPRKWTKLNWVDQYSGTSYRISTTDNCNSRKTARVKTYGDVIVDYSFHAEPKCADANGVASTKQTVGLLQRRHLRIAGITSIGKESNTLEDVGIGLIHSIDDVYTVYPDLRRDEWRNRIVPALKQVPLSVLAKESGLSRRTIINARTGKRRPHPNNQRTLIEILRTRGLLKVSSWCG